MPSVTLPLVGAANRRGYKTDGNTKDQRYIGVLFHAVRNALSGNTTVYAEKRPGWDLVSTYAGGSGLNAHAIFHSPSADKKIVLYKNTASTTYTVVYDGSSVGTFDGKSGLISVSDVIETVISGVTYFLWTTQGTDRGGWFFAEDASAQTSYAGDTHTNTTIDNIASTAGMYAGQAISGSGIQAGTRIASVDSGTAITTTLATTATASGVTITKTPIAKIIDADFPSSTISWGFSEMDGYVFAITRDGKVYNSDLNSVTSWSASGFISLNMSTDDAVTIAKYKNQLLAFGDTSTEWLYNAGNPSGSPLGRTEQSFTKFGMYRKVPTDENPKICNIGDMLFVVGQEGNSDSRGVYVLDGSRFRRVSTPNVQRAVSFWEENSVYFLATLDGFSAFGYSYLLFQIGSDTTLLESWLYCIELDMWVESGFPYFFRMTSTGPLNAATLNASAGKIYELGADTNSGTTPTIKFQDEGSAYTMTIQTSPWSPQGAEGDWVFVHSVELLADTEASGTATLETSDDDYTTWVSRGTFDMTAQRKHIERCGAFRNSGRAFRITHAANTGFRARAIKVTYSVGD